MAIGLNDQITFIIGLLIFWIVILILILYTEITSRDLHRRIKNLTVNNPKTDSITVKKDET